MKGDHDVALVEEFEAARPRLLSLAHRIVGSVHDAEDAVQTAWLRTQTAGPGEMDNPEGWFTTVTARLCLDQLRARQRRGELPLLAEQMPADQLAADEEYLRREAVSRALLVLLTQLSPGQRVAYVLHDLFAVPFEHVAVVLRVSPSSAKKLASRARIRLRGAEPADAQGSDEHAEIVDAFLAAARGGDVHRLVALMAPDVVRTADATLLPDTAPIAAHGAAAVAEETRFFLDRIAATVPMVVDGRPGGVIAPGGHPFALLRFQIRDRLIAAIEITRYDSAVHLGGYTWLP
jgi:RNA polymerase sigma-70 factor (ECF subfamily)